MIRKGDLTVTVPGRPTTSDQAGRLLALEASIVHPPRRVAGSFVATMRCLGVGGKSSFGDCRRRDCDVRGWPRMSREWVPQKMPASLM